MKRKIANVIILLIFLAGLAILLYPTVSDYVNEKNSSRAIAAYDQSAQDMAPEDYSQELEAAAAYNTYLTQYGSLSAAASAEAKREDNPYETLLNAGGNGVMAVIRIPCVDINLPVYHGTDEAVLQVAAGHYLGSSLPVGGPGTHAVITGHRGLPSARLFTDLDRLEIGDIFYIKVLGEILEYEIDQIQTVLPSELDSLSITPGEDYVTLVTCTPYGINSHRLLVHGKRVEYDGNYEEKVPIKPAPENSDLPPEERGNGLSERQWILIAAVAFAAAILLGLLIPGKKKTPGDVQPETDAGRNRKRKRKTAEGSKTEKKEGSHENET